MWREKAATSPGKLAQLLLTDPVVDALRKAVRRDTGHNADVERVREVLASEVIRPGL
ncbi:MAG: hypothetical protein ACH36H_01395 [Candidatus Nanopelagicales bacterium]